MPVPIFVVDSSPAVRRLVEQISTPEGFDVIGFQDGSTALESAKQTSPALIIADYNLENMTFSGFCKEINKLDHLTDTYIISLINSADHPDEGHLRSLGVKAFLNKPFQSEDLLGILQSIPQKQPALSGTGLKRRAWPPSADDEIDTPTHSITGKDRPLTRPVEPQKTSLAPTPLPIPIPTPTPIPTSIPTPTPAPVSTPAMGPVSSGPQDAMKGLFDQLLLSVTKETEKRLAEVLPGAIEEKLPNHVRPLIQQDIRAQLGAILSMEQLAAIIQPLLSRELPPLLEKEIAKYEPLIRQAASDAAGSLAAEKVDHWVREQAETGIRKHVSDMIREHIGAIDQMVKDEVRAAVAQQAPQLADDVVRATAEQSVEQSVRRIVPELAEQHIQAELKRLTAPD